MRSDHDDASSARRIRGFLVGVKYGGNKSSLFAHSLADGEGRGTADPGAGGGAAAGDVTRGESVLAVTDDR